MYLSFPGLAQCYTSCPVRTTLLLVFGLAMGFLYTNVTNKYRIANTIELSINHRENKSSKFLTVDQVGCAVKMDRHRYVCPTLGYRLGNMMFLYASNYGVAYDYNLTLALDERDAIYEPFINIPKSSLDRARRCAGFKMRFIQERARYYQKFKIPRNGNVALYGYLQTWKYFSHSFEDLKQQFRWKWNIHHKALRIIKKLSNTYYALGGYGHVTTVGIHIRRGDYVREHRPMADREYVETAKSYFLERYKHVLFIVATNVDEEAKQWSEANVINGSGLSVFAGFNNKFVDMAVLSLCKHVIISTGTYGWWAGFLNKGRVVHYDWIPPHHVKFNREDYILPQWIGIKPTHAVKY